MFAARHFTAALLIALCAAPLCAAHYRRPAFHRASLDYAEELAAASADVEAASEQIGDLRTQISDLRSQLLEEKSATLALKQKLAASAAQTPKAPEPTVNQQPSVPVPAAPLSRGDRGAEVAQLQDAMVHAGLMDANHPYLRMGRGIFGPYTTATVAAVQQDHMKTEATGVYDAAVRAFLVSKLSAPAAARASTPAVPTPQYKPCCLCAFLPVVAVIALVANLLSSASFSLPSCCPLVACARAAPCVLMKLPCLIMKAAFGVASILFAGFAFYHLAGLALSVLALALTFGCDLFLLLAPYTLLALPLLLFKMSPCGRRFSCPLTSASPCQSPCRVFKFFSSCSPCRFFAASPRVPEGNVLPSPTLSRGARGPGVAQLQDILIQLDMMTPAMVKYCKGNYGRFTTQAVANIQRNLALEPTGVYDAAVRDHLFSKMGMEAPAAEESTLPVPAAPLSRGMRGEEVAQLQDALVAAGFMNGSHPFIRMGRGMFGPYTTATVAAIQREELDVEGTGIYDEAVRALLLSKLAPAPAEEPNNESSNEESPAPAAAAAPPAAPEVPAAAAQEEAQPAPAPKSEDVKLTEEFPVPPAKTEAVDPTTARKTLLLELGFDAAEVDSALEATQGSLENAAEWLFVNWKDNNKQAAPEPAFPEEWVELVNDLAEMGFEEEKARAALVQTQGVLKDAVKALVVMERERSE